MKDSQNRLYLTDPYGSDLGAKLLSAREARGLSIREVAGMMPPDLSISHVTLSSYEKGKTRPPVDVLSALAAIYGRTPNWFLEQTLPLTGVRYRHYKSKVSAAEKRQYEAEGLRWLEAYLRIESWLGEGLNVEVKCPQKPDQMKPRAYAAEVRKALGLNDHEPVQSVVHEMQRCGIRVIELSGPEGIDGFAGYIGDQSVVVLNSRCSSDRMRLNESHEFFHGLLGHGGEAGAGGDDEEEDDAFACGRYFLIPPKELEEAFRRQSFVDLVRAKEKYGISLGAMIYAAQQDKLISPALAKKVWIELTRRGWRAKEPGFVRADRATRFESLLDGAINSKRMDWRQAASVTGIPVSELEHRVQTAMGITHEELPEPSKGGEPTFQGMRLAK